jgi:hypothetical protein
MLHSTQKDDTMNDDTGDRRQWRELPRWAGILAAIVSIAMLTSGCGGGASAGSSASPSPASTQAKLIAWAQCMRTHGVPNFPDPNSHGVFNGNVANPQSAQVQSAQRACKSLQPNIGQSGQGQAQRAAQALRFSKCMRAHGVPNYPDPNSSGNFHISRSSGINPQSPTFQSAQRVCQSIMPGLGQQSGG